MVNTQNNEPMNPGEFLLYETEDGRARVECRFVASSLWLSQAAMADLFQTTKQNIAKHLKAIFSEGELAQDSVVNQWLTTAADGKSYRVSHYNLDAILAVGYRVRSTRGTQFRRWATDRLRDYLVNGFLLDDERLKNPPVGDSAAPDRFNVLLARIRDIRASERRMPKRNMSSSPPSGGRCWSPRGPSSICALWKKQPKPCPSPQKAEATPPPSTSRPLSRPAKP